LVNCGQQVNENVRGKEWDAQQVPRSTFKDVRELEALERSFGTIA